MNENQASSYDNSPDTATSDQLFDSGWATRTLAAQLDAEIPGAFKGYTAGVWCRGSICRALAARGVTLKKINFRKS